MGSARPPRPPAPRTRKRRGQYHHGDLRRALIEEAVRTIREQGVDELTLRGVGQALGVSRTALYRHFAHKSALLQAVGTDGFRRFRLDLEEAWDGAGRGPRGLDAMGRAYVRFAVANPSHFRVMFGGVLGDDVTDPDLQRERAAAFQVLFDAIVALQAGGDIRRDDPMVVSRYVWAVVHGIAMLSLDVPSRHPLLNPESDARYGVERLRLGLQPDRPQVTRGRRTRGSPYEPGSSRLP
ncbi:MAG: TetR/AcrR family transcriptional regulator [Vicinamibacterales bacterium]